MITELNLPSEGGNRTKAITIADAIVRDGRRLCYRILDQ